MPPWSSLDANLPGPRARFHAVHRPLRGYPEPENAPDRDGIKPLPEAPWIPTTPARGRRDARPEPKRIPIDALHAALLALRGGNLKSLLKDPPGSVRKGDRRAGP
ncbi:MAG: hypothetical protein ABGY09_02710, partial [Euryarchaeota archaeon]